MDARSFLKNMLYFPIIFFNFVSVSLDSTKCCPSYVLFLVSISVQNLFIALKQFKYLTILEVTFQTCLINPEVGNKCWKLFSLVISLWLTGYVLPALWLTLIKFVYEGWADQCSVPHLSHLILSLISSVAGWIPAWIFSIVIYIPWSSQMRIVYYTLHVHI